MAPVRAPGPCWRAFRGHAKATVATAHKILTAAYHVLDRGDALETSA
jgi:hypothetical protein